MAQRQERRQQKSSGVQQPACEQAVGKERERKASDWVPGGRVMSQPGWSLAVKPTCHKPNTKAKNGEKRPNTAEHIAHPEPNGTTKLLMAERTLGVPQPT